MDEQENIKQIVKEQVRFRILFVIMAMVAAGMSIFFLVQNNPVPNSAAPDNPLNPIYSESFYGLVPGTSTEIIITSKGHNVSYPIKKTDDAGTIQYSAVKLDVPVNAYTVNITLKKPDDSYLDISLFVNNEAGEVKIELDGFKPDTKVSMFIDDWTGYSDIPVDWTGRLSLDAKRDEIPAVCLTIKEDKTFSYCHTNYGGVQS